MSGQPSVIGMVLAIRSAVAACNSRRSIGFQVRLTIIELGFASDDDYNEGPCVRLIIECSVLTLSGGLFVRLVNGYQISDHDRCGGSTLDRKSGVPHLMSKRLADKWLRHEKGIPGFVQYECFFIN